MSLRRFPTFGTWSGFHDHVRLESMLFDGALDPACGVVAPHVDRPGPGLSLRRADAERYRVS
jgi:hypothetical protein